MINDDHPRAEHPRPQFVRSRWLNLNGWWDFQLDQGDSGLERGLVAAPLTERVLVPFAPESEASGIGNPDYLQAVWYRRTVTVPADWDGRVLLHFGAVDYDTTVWVNGVEAGRHRGGFSSFTVDLGIRAPGTVLTITVRARDLREQTQARGKQARQFLNNGCFYTRTTGIWQTVWIESVPETHLRRVATTPRLADGVFSFRAVVSRNRPGWRFRATVLSGGRPVAEAETRADLDLSPTLEVRLPEDAVRTWSPEDPHLYDVVFELVDAHGETVDEVTSYAGLRSVSIDGQALLLNGEPVFQRLVLDQGYWPETLMTAPSDEALRRDIELALEAGFNGARLHQKAFEERYLYHADRAGFLVWGEYGDWGVNGLGPTGHNQQPTSAFVGEWLEILQRDVSHPAIIGWCPLNETAQKRHDRTTVLDDVTHAMFLATKLVDPSRPVIDASGYSHREPTDVYDSHSYKQDPAEFAVQQSGLASGAPFVNTGDPVGDDEEREEWSLPYAGQPYFVSEFGGIWWNPALAPDPEAGDDILDSWGYGDRVANLEEFYARFEGLVGVLLDDPRMFGYCYTQLTDVFQEENGVYAFDRSAKFDVARIRAIQQRQSAYEQTVPSGRQRAAAD
ncbi:glycoside hydrolase family 2 protein [Naasia sp. SYSU D00057]|uniref:glycoside hydrolase family 2 protein n=1 Tax=Naasia sp. SYSU D00057 TaxID=2817380 RepID=UPI001B30599B|nr:sugar-binding domain-containing protein [Naasia sp. SYSU D00057]